MGPSHYEVLAVSRRASPDQIRAAYRRRVAEVHPDRFVDAAPARRAQADADMRAVTEAWRVLGDSRRRQAYDRSLGIGEDPLARALRIDDARFTAAATNGAAPDEPVDGAARVARALPWVAVLIVLALIFVFTAYALHGSSKGGTGSVGDCISVDATTGEIAPAACDAAGARRISAVVNPAQPCPTGTESLVPPAGASKLCLEER